MSLSVIAAALEAPAHIAIATEAGVISFAEMGARVRSTAAALLARDIDTKPSALRPIAVLARPELETLELLHALIALGVAFLPVSPKLTERERSELISECRASPLLDPRTLRETDRARPAPSLTPVPDDERPLAIVATSGTSGRPRGVVLSRRAFAAAAQASAQNLGFRDDDRWLLGLPLGHIGGLSILTRCLFARRALVLPRHTGSFDPDALAETIVDKRVSLLSLVPTQLARLLERNWQPPSSLRAVLMGGARAPAKLMAEAVARGIPALTTYGLTEACSQVTTQNPSELGEAGVGRPLAGVELRVVDGEVQVRGSTLMSGYHPAELHPDPRLSGGWLPTRDLGFIDAAGRLHVLGRKDDVIVTGGEKVHPAEVEAVLERCPGVSACSVFGVEDETWGARVAAAIVLEPGQYELDAAFAAHIERELAPFKRPRLIAYLAALPLTPTGKLDRRAVHEMASRSWRPSKGSAV